MCETDNTFSFSAKARSVLSFISTPPKRIYGIMHEHRGRVAFPLSMFMCVVELQERVKL
jgi:hypothetical protein